MQPVGRLGDLRRKDVAALQLLYPLQRFDGGLLPEDLPVAHQQHMFAVVGDVFGVVLDDDDGLAVLFVQLPQHLIDAVGVHRVQLGDRLIEDEDVRLQRDRPGQRQQMGLPAGKLPDIFLLAALQPALLQRLSAALLVVGEGVV